MRRHGSADSREVAVRLPDRLEQMPAPDTLTPMAWRHRKGWLVATACVAAGVLALLIPPPPYRSSQEGRIQEALLRHLLKGWSVETAAVSMNGAEVSDELRKALSDLRVRLSAPGAAEMNNEGSVVDPQGKPSVTCHIGPVVWHSVVSVEVHATLTEGLMGSTDAVYRLSRSLDGWHVVGSESVVVS